MRCYMEIVNIDVLNPTAAFLYWGFIVSYFSLKIKLFKLVKNKDTSEHTLVNAEVNNSPVK